MYVRSLADSGIASVHLDVFENLLNSKVAFNETVSIWSAWIFVWLHAHIFWRGYHPVFAFSWSIMFMICPPCVIQKFDSHLKKNVIKLFTQWWSTGDTSFLLQIWSCTVVVTMSRQKKIFETQWPNNKSILAGENGMIDSSGQSLCTGNVEYFLHRELLLKIVIK